MSTRRAPAECPSSLPLTNRQIAEELLEIADLLEVQNANQFRVQAYRKAAQTLTELTRHVHEILRFAGSAGLLRLPVVGYSLARAIEQLAITGRLGMLERMRSLARNAVCFAASGASP